MHAGDVIAGRFRIDRRAGVGGMGTVYRAFDVGSGAPVAVKLLDLDDPALEARFLREAQLLAALRHPAIVGYVSHGVTPEGRHFLAMEWLDGEDLAARLERGTLAPAEAVAMAARVCDALALAHNHGVVHRDLKPSNLFWPAGGAADAVKVLDFGIARALGETATKTGQILGSPGYMAPEQARGLRDLDARADVFSLGCVIFACLTGRSPFSGEHAAAVLAKVLFDEAAPLRQLRPDVPAALEALVARMLAKEPAARPAGAAAVAEALARIDATVVAAAPSTPSLATSAAVGATERRHVCVLLAGGARAAAPTITPEEAQALPSSASQVVTRFGARVEELADGTIVAAFARGVATDMAARAARCALALSGVMPRTPIALAMGRGVAGAPAPAGEAIDAASAILTAVNAARAAGGVWLDETTARLLEGRFEVAVEGPERRRLAGGRGRADVARPLVGKPTSCVGRERELAMLEAILDEVVSEPRPRVVLVTAPAGVGKSRLRDELLRRLEGRDPAVAVWSGHGDPMRAGAPLGLLADALREPLGLDEGGPPEARRERIATRVARRHAGEEAARVAEFVGELVGVPFTDDDRVVLRTARRDPAVMSDQLRRAWEDFAAAEAAAGPVLLVLEDLHWGDWPTIQFVDAALRSAAGAPFMVLALARPEVHDLFARPWEHRGLEEIRLRELPRAACERLIRQVLGRDADAEVVGRIFERSEGNAFYLEELIRAAAEGGDATPPPTVLAMLESRLERLPAEARLVLRAASVFGQSFWAGGAAALLSGAAPGEALAQLAEREWVTGRKSSRFAGEAEYGFRHALAREAAYGSLTESDRAAGHRLAAAWLERAGEPDAATLAEHWRRGGERGRAAACYQRASEDALAAGDLPGAVARADQAVECGASGEVLGAARLVQAEAHNWRGEKETALERGREAVTLLPRGGAGWAHAWHQVSWAACAIGDVTEARRAADEIVDAVPAALEVRHLVALGAVVGNCCIIGDRERSRAGLELLRDRGRPLAEREPMTEAWLHVAEFWWAAFHGDLGTVADRLRDASAAFERAGDRRNAVLNRANLGCACSELGDLVEAESLLSDVLAAAARHGLGHVSVIAGMNLARARLRRGDLEGAERDARATLAAVAALTGRQAGMCRTYLAEILLAAGRAAEAHVEAVAAVELLRDIPPVLPQALAILAAAEARLGRREAALTLARRAVEVADRQGGLEEGESVVRLVYAEILRDAGDVEGARAAAATARDRLLARAAKLHDPAWRTKFLEQVPENARTLALVRELGGG